MGICGRTQQVQDAIVAAINEVSDCAHVTGAHLEGITSLDLAPETAHDESTAIRSLKAGDFAGLSSLTHLDLGSGSGYITTIPANAFSGLSSLRTLNLNSHGQLTTISSNAFSGLSSLINLDLSYNQRLTTLNPGMLSGLSSLHTFNLAGNGFTTVPSGVFSDTPNLSYLNLSANQIATLDAGAFTGLSMLGSLQLQGNQLTALPDGVFTGLTSLALLELEDNSAVLEVRVSLVRVDDDEFKVTVHTGAPFHMRVPVTVVNGNIESGASEIVIPEGEAESPTFRIIGAPDAPGAPTVNLGELPALPSGVLPHNGYVLVKSVRTGAPQVARTPFAGQSAPRRWT